ncbi:MAG: DNA polymerase beta superfamily protein, partial [Planctomycetia bacterium]
VLKKDLYIVRPVLAAQWVAERATPPPMRIGELLQMIADRPAVTAAVVDLIATKKAGGEVGLGDRIPVLDDFLSTELTRLQTIAPAASDAYDVAPLDALFRKLIGAAKAV